MNGGAIAGAVCGPVFGLLGIGGYFYFYGKKSTQMTVVTATSKTASDLGDVDTVSGAADVKVDDKI